MAHTVRMPALSPIMTHATLGRWLVREGDEIASGDALAELETDKAVVEYEAVCSGRVGRLLLPEGSTDVPVNTPIAILLMPGEADLPPMPQEPHPIHEGGGKEMSETEDIPSPPPSRVAASQLARRLAAEAGLSLETLTGRGPDGRIVAADVTAACRGHSRPGAGREAPEETGIAPALRRPREADPAALQPAALLIRLPLQKLAGGAFDRRVPDRLIEQALCALALEAILGLSGVDGTLRYRLLRQKPEAKKAEDILLVRYAGADGAETVMPLAPLAGRVTLHLGAAQPADDGKPAYATLAFCADPALVPQALATRMVQRIAHAAACSGAR